ncbi:MAG: Arm DNA-binding domain-containing protein, partial [Candidatus Accumulibacter sp.]|nr:Arm DNA-binding domain-containing protein [Accumulibacter sp.]
MLLTDAAVKNAKPTDKPARIFDGGGMYLEISPSGGKLWRMKYRFGGKEKRLALGTYPTVSLKEARERRDEARKLLAHGADPGEVRKAQKAAKQARAAD